MFFRKDASFEIADAMENALISEATESQDEQIVKFAKAIDHLNAVAELFEELGMAAEADTATTFIEVLAAKKKKKTAPKKKKPSQSKTHSKSKSKTVSKSKSKQDSATKGLDADKMVENLEHRGWVFNADDQVHPMGCECSMCSDGMPMQQQDVGMANDFLGQLENNDASDDQEDVESMDLEKLMADLEKERVDLEAMDFEDEK